MIKIQTLVFLLSSLCSSSLLFAQEFKTIKISLKNYTKTHGTCWDSADALADKFTSLTQIDAEGTCVSDNKVNYHIELEYQAEKALNKVSSNSILGSPLSYTDLNSCVANLADQEKIFKAQTGLSPLAFYCTRSSFNYSPSKKFELKFLAFGESEVKPFFQAMYLFGKIYGYSVKSFFSEVSDLYEQYDAKVAAIKLTPALANASLDLLYYGKERLQLSQHNSKAIPQKADCLTELNAIKARLDGARLIAYCASVIGNELNFVWLEAEKYQFISSGENYSTFSDCQAMRMSIVDKFEKKNAKIKAGFCEKDGKNSFKITLIKRSI